MREQSISRRVVGWNFQPIACLPIDRFRWIGFLLHLLLRELVYLRRNNFFFLLLISLGRCALRKTMKTLIALSQVRKARKKHPIINYPSDHARKLSLYRARALANIGEQDKFTPDCGGRNSIDEAREKKLRKKVRRLSIIFFFLSPLCARGKCVYIREIRSSRVKVYNSANLMKVLLWNAGCNWR